MHPLLQGVRLISIDLDDTLWPCAPVIQRAEHLLFDWLGRVAPRLTARHDLHSLRQHRKALAEAQPQRAHDLSWLRHEHLRLLLTEFGYAEQLAGQGLEVFRRARNQVSPYPEVAEVLGLLRRDFILVSMTNGNAEVEETPLRGLFHLHLTAADTGAAKPDQAMFRAALQRTGCKPGQSLHIGDDPHRDIAPARALGMRTLWIQREPTPWPGTLTPADGAMRTLQPLVKD